MSCRLAQRNSTRQRTTSSLAKVWSNEEQFNFWRLQRLDRIVTVHRTLDAQWHCPCATGTLQPPPVTIGSRGLYAWRISTLRTLPDNEVRILKFLTGGDGAVD